jgi:multidrug resistance protein, MATE family
LLCQNTQSGTATARRTARGSTACSACTSSARWRCWGWRAGDILASALGQDPAIAAEAGAYARWLVPSLLAYVPLPCHVRFLQAQGAVLPVTATSGVTALCHPAVCWALVHGTGMGSRGAALSNAVSYALNLVLLPLYVRLSGACRATWNGFSRDGLTELGRFTQLAVPSAMMIWSHRNCNFL